MKAYKLVRVLKDGNYYSLFINKKVPFVFDEWKEAEFHPTKGFAPRYGWHCCFTPYAPHLAMELSNGEERVWMEVEVKDYEVYDRPESQGGAWVLAKWMKPVRILDNEEVVELLNKKIA